MIAEGSSPTPCSGRAEGTDPRASERDTTASQVGVTLPPLPLDELLSKSDYISVHCPLTADTKGLVSKRELALMKPSAVVINAARGGVVDELGARVLSLWDAKNIKGLRWCTQRSVFCNCVSNRRALFCRVNCPQHYFRAWSRGIWEAQPLMCSSVRGLLFKIMSSVFAGDSKRFSCLHTSYPLTRNGQNRLCSFRLIRWKGVLPVMVRTEHLSGCCRRPASSHP